MDGPRKFSSEDNHEAVESGRLAPGNKVVKPPGAVIKEGADELMSRVWCALFIDTMYVGDQRSLVRLVDADWHAVCQAIFQGVEAPEWKPCVTTTRTFTKR